jgi:hypothetical protein
MASPFEPRARVGAKLEVAATQVAEMVGELEAIPGEMLGAEEETAAAATAVAGMVVVEGTVAAEVALAVADTATAVGRIRAVVTVMVPKEATGTIDRNPPVTYLISRIGILL